MQEQVFFYNDQRFGTAAEFHANGQRKSKITYSSAGPYYDQFWDVNGKPLLTQGTGMVEETNTRGNVRLSHYEDHAVIKSMEIRQAEGDTLYSKTEKTPQYKRGMNFLYQFLAAHVKYPKEAKKKSIEGKVFVGFVVDEDGRVSETKTLRGIGYGCDKEAERVLAKANNWIPGEVQGQPVKTFVVIPVTFRLR